MDDLRQQRGCCQDPHEVSRLADPKTTTEPSVARNIYAFRQQHPLLRQFGDDLVAQNALSLEPIRAAKVIL
jgi:hypothetical protein